MDEDFEARRWQKLINLLTSYVSTMCCSCKLAEAFGTKEVREYARREEVLDLAKRCMNGNMKSIRLY